MRVALLLGCLVGSVVLGGCSGDKACTSCDAVAGSYTLTFIGNVNTAGTCGADVPTLTEGTLVLSGTGSAITGSYGSFTDLTGTLYQSGSLSLVGSNSPLATLGDGGTGTSSSHTLTLSLKYVAAAGTAPNELNGSATQLDSAGSTTTPSSCTQTANVTAAQE